MKKEKFFILSLLFCLLFIGCTTSSKYTSSSRYQKELKEAKSKDRQRKILYNTYLAMTVEKSDTANVYVERIAEKYKGYVNTVGSERTILRVNSNDLDSALKDISGLGKVRRKTMTGQDVTEDYLDSQIRLENAEKSRKRYLELLAKAETVEATLKVEKELERLNETIELMKGKMSRIDHLSDFSTITIDWREKKKPGLLGYVGLGLYHSVKWLFVRN